MMLTFLGIINKNRNFLLSFKILIVCLFSIQGWAAENINQASSTDAEVQIHRSNRDISSEELPSQLNIGFIPGGDLASTKESGFKLAQFLQKELGVPINVVISKSYGGLIELMKDRKIDFALFSSFTFIEAEQKAGAKVLLKTVFESPFYYSTILVLDEKIKTINDLKGKKIGFVDQKSSSGYLYPRLAFQKLGILEKDFKSLVFSGSHSKSVELLEEASVDAIAVFADDAKAIRNAWGKYSGLNKSNNKKNSKKAKVLWVSEPIPNDPFCVRKDFYEAYPKLTHSLMTAVIEGVEFLIAKKELKDFMGAKTLAPATSKQYEPVRDVVKSLGIHSN